MNKELILEQASEVFRDINNRINLLIDCSARDFDILNKGFIEYHSKINELTENTGNLFEGLLTLSDDALDTLFQQLEEISAATKEIYEIVDLTWQGINQLIKDISYAFLHLNNQNQNISTLKLLTTNIQLEPASRSIYTVLIEQVNSLQSLSKQISVEFRKKENRIQTCAEHLNRIRADQLPIVIQRISQYVKLISGLKERKNMCREFNEILQSLLSKKSMSSSEIITNLQFQDIVRQKIEHVKEAQGRLLDKLRHYTPKTPGSGEESTEDKLSIIFQIRDIGALQAAQMVHANNEYQKAVEVITEKFEELDNIQVEITHLLNKLSPELNAADNYSFEDLIKAKSYLELEFDTLSDSVSVLEKMNPDICRKDELLSHANQEINDSIKNCQQTIKNLKSADLEEEDEAMHTSLVHQLKKNFEGLLLSSGELNKLFGHNHNEIEEHIIPGLENLFSHLAQAGKLVSRGLEISDSLFADKAFSRNSEKISGNKIELSGKKFDPNAIQYYSVFDKEIEEIISNLNHLINSIDFKEIEKDLDEKGKLNDIKQLYTMDSERTVHSMVTGEKTKTKRKKKSNEDLELF